MVGFTAALAATAVGLQVYGQVKQGQDAKAAADYNALVYRQQAQVIDVRKSITAEQYDRTIDQLRGSTTVAISGQGRDLSGSALHVLNDNLTQAQMDKQIEIYNLEVDRSRAISTSKEYSITGERELGTSRVKAASSLLTGGNDWYQKYGGFGTTK